MLIQLHSYTVWAIGLGVTFTLVGALALAFVMGSGTQHRHNRGRSRRHVWAILVGIPLACGLVWALATYGFLAAFGVGA